MEVLSYSYYTHTRIHTIQSECYNSGGIQNNGWEGKTSIESVVNKIRAIVTEVWVEWAWLKSSLGDLWETMTRYWLQVIDGKNKALREEVYMNVWQTKW